MKVSSFFWNVRRLGNHKTMEMLISLLKLRKPLLVFLAEPVTPYTDAFDVLFKSLNMHLVATCPIINTNQVSCNEFLDWINTNYLSYMPFTGSCYAWCNERRGLHRIHRRLDRALCNGVCLDE